MADARHWLLAAALAAILFDTRGGTSRPAPPLPLRGPGLVGHAQPLTAEELAQLSGAPATKRVYTLDGRRLRALAVDAAVNRHAWHDPGYCLAGRGYQLVSHADRAATRGTVAIDRYQRGPERITLVYFHAAGSRWSSSSWSYFADFLRARVDREFGAELRWNLLEVQGDDAKDSWLVQRALPAIFE